MIGEVQAVPLSISLIMVQIRDRFPGATIALR